ncbi:hypothetical protein ACFLZX_05810 [Nanoarchaeota archaeon]
MLNIKSKRTSTGFDIFFRGKRYPLSYEKGHWGKIPEDLKETLQRNLTLLSTIHLPLLFREEKISYDMGFPIFETFIYQNMVYNIPKFTGQKTTEAIKNFMNIEFEYQNYDFEIPQCSFTPENKVIIPFSFSKEQILSLALCNEIGIDATLVNIEDSKLNIQGDFFKQGFSIEHIENKTGLLKNDLGFGLGYKNMESCLLLSTYLINKNAKLILHDNKQENNNINFDDEGFICYPSFDKSNQSLLQHDSMIKILTDNKCGVSSFVGPLSDIGIVKVLKHRYPNLAKFAQLKNDKDKFRILSKTNEGDYRRDEHLLSFYLDYKNGEKGGLINEFKKKFLKEAVDREDELIKSYLSIRSADSIPKDMKKEVLSIFKEAL